MRKIILASSSPSRKLLLEKLQLPFTIIPPGTDETPKPNEPIKNLVQRLAKEKAHAIKNYCPDALIIGGDSVAELEGKVIGKPLTHDIAIKQLQNSSGKTVNFYSGLCLLDSCSGQEQVGLETYSVTFRHLNLTMIENYLNKEQPYSCVGSVKAEGLGIALFEKMEGTDFNTLLGLPLIRLINTLKNVGLEILDF